MDHDVGGLDVAVDDPFLVGVIQGRRGLAQDPEDRRRIRRLRAAEYFLEGGAVHELHRDVGQVALLGHVVDGHDARVR